MNHITDFEIVREPWNKYEISDGSILKTRFVLKKIQLVKVADNKFNFNLDGQNLSVIYGSQDLKGTPDERAYSPMELKSAVIKDDLRYSTLYEEWNEYLMDDATRVKLKTIVTKVSRTNKYDKTGDPIYLIDTNAMMNIKKPNQPL